MRPISLSYTPEAASTTGYASGVSGTSGVAFVLASSSPGDGLGHTITIAPSGSVTGNYTITGTDSDGNVLTETLATNTTSTVTSVYYYATVTEILAPSGIGAATVDIGWTGVSVSPTVVMDWKSSPFSVGFGVDISGTINYTVQHTFANVLDPLIDSPSAKWWDHSSVASKTADTDGNYAFNIAAIRLLINSVSAGATANIQIIQGDIT